MNAASSKAVEVLICIPVLLVGGTELHTLALARALQSAGAKARVCCYYEYSSAMVLLFEGAGIEVTLLRMQRAAGLWRLFLALRRLFRRIRPGALHVQYIAPGLIPVAAAKAAGVSVVFATVHQPGDTYGSRERLMLSVAARLCTAFFCVSQAVERSWFSDSAVFSIASAASGRRHFTIYNGVDVVRAEHASTKSAAEELRRRLGIAGRHVIGIVARLRAEKGHASLLNALPLVLKRFPDLALLVVGDGPDREVLMNHGRALGVCSHIVWVGELSPEETLACYEVMDVVAIPSQFEGFGLSAAEAMAAGCPVVAARVGGLAEIIEDGVTGFLVAPGDNAGFAAALITALSDPGKAINMGASGRKRVWEHFSSERFAESFAGAYRYFMKVEAFCGGTAGRQPLVP